MGSAGASAADSGLHAPRGGPVAPGVLYYDPNPTTAKLATAGLRLAGYEVHNAVNQEQAVELCRSHGPGGDRTIVALLLDTATAPAVSASVLRALVEVPGAAELPGVLLVSRTNPIPFPGAEALPSIKRPFATPALLKVLREVIDEPPKPKPAPVRTVVDTAVTRLGRALVQHFPGLKPEEDAVRNFTNTLTTTGGLPTPAAAVTLQAALGPTRLESLLELLDADAARGVLTVENGEQWVRLHLDRGRLRMAESRIDREDLRLFRFIVEAGLVAEAELDRIAEATDPRGRGLAERVLEDGHVRPDELNQVLITQAREIACHVFAWTEGRATFAAAERLHALVDQVTKGKGELRIAEVLLVGLRREDERAEMGPHIAALDEVFVRVDPEVAKLGRNAFTREELTVLELANGRHSVKEMARKARAGTFAIAKVLYRLSRAGLVRRRAPTVQA
jgi:CheY-like chemotaxis protein